MNILNKVALEETTKDDYKFLYDLLQLRSDYANISHIKMPTYDEHCKYMNTHIGTFFTHHYIITHKDHKCGTMYLTRRNELGIFLLPQYQSRGIGHKALELFIKTTKKQVYYANVAPMNFNSQGFMVSNGFTRIQITYRREVK